jgi:predicted NBD/HSP70 family sugar kinase/predicted transcriptional regulator
MMFKLHLGLQVVDPFNPNDYTYAKTYRKWKGMAMNASTMRLKEINIDTVRHILRNNESVTKNSIAEMTGLSVASCGNILSEFLNSGEIQKIELAESTGGRPSRRYIYNFDYAHIATLYLRKEGHSNRLYSSVSNLAGVPEIEEFTELPNVGISDIESVLSKYLAGIPSINSVGIGIPGVVHKGEIGICDFPGLAGVRLVPELENHLQLPVVAENDVNLAALGNHYSETGKSVGSSVCLYYPKGGNPGAGIIINGGILKGGSNFAGEVSYLPLDVPLDKQGSLAETPEKFTTVVSKTIQSVISIVNPQKLVLIGLAFTDEMLTGIRDSIALSIPEAHIPELHFDPDIHNRLVAGLKYLAMNELSCGFQLVNTKEKAIGV